MTTSNINICVIGFSEGEEREKGAENISENSITENFPNLGKETDIQVQEAQKVPYRINRKRTWKNLKREYYNQQGKSNT